VCAVVPTPTTLEPATAFADAATLIVPALVNDAEAVPFGAIAD
jgi:hypothetical protein